MFGAVAAVEFGAVEAGVFGAAAAGVFGAVVVGVFGEVVAGLGVLCALVASAVAKLELELAVGILEVVAWV